VSPEALFTGVLLLYILVFFSINARNVIRGLRARKGMRAYAELERPKGLFMNLAALGTLVFFAEALLFVCLGLTGLGSYLRIRPLQLSFAHDLYVRAAGLVVMGAGFTVFVWSVVSRVATRSHGRCLMAKGLSPGGPTGSFATRRTSGTSSCSWDSSLRGSTSFPSYP